MTGAKIEICDDEAIDHKGKMLRKGPKNASTLKFGATMGDPQKKSISYGTQGGLLPMGSSRNHQRGLVPKSNTGEVGKSRPMYGGSQSQMLIVKSTEKERVLSMFCSPCRISSNRRSGVSKGSWRWLTFQSNGKLIVFDSKEDPLDQDAAYNKGLKPEYLASLLDYGAIEQNNLNESCFQDLVIDFGLLLQSSIKIRDPNTLEDIQMPALKIVKSQLDPKSMEIQVYRVNLSNAKAQIENNSKILPGDQTNWLDGTTNPLEEEL